MRALYRLPVFRRCPDGSLAALLVFVGLLLAAPPRLAGQSVQIYPQAGSVSQPANSSGRTSVFTVVNGTGYTVTLSCGSTSPVTCTRMSASWVGPYKNLTDTLTYSTGAPGSGILKLYTEPVNSQVDSGYYNVTVLLVYQVAVTPKAGKTESRQTNTSGYSVVFTVQNKGYYQDTYTITCSSTSPVTCTGVKPTSITLASLASTTDTAYYNVGAVDTGTVTLTAASSHASDVGVDTVPVIPTPVTPTGPVIARDLCLTIAAGDDAAYECGDLRIVHPLPSIRTLDKARTPTLLYDSRHAYPFPSLNTDLTLSANDRPDSIVAIARLEVGGAYVQRDRRAWAGTEWGDPAQTATRRVMTNFAASDLQTGLYPFQLELDRFVAGVGFTAIRTDTGTIAIVNRLNSPFGAGWWLAGFEQLQFPADGSLLWIGGDGSVRRYVKAGSWGGKDWYLARSLDGPDSLSFDGTTYTRYLKGGAKVLFNTSGFHTQSVNRIGYATVFTPDGSNRLSSITLPPAGAGRNYTFTYGGPNGTLSSVAAPDSLGGSSRITTITGSALTGGERIASITDPGTTGSVQFSYDSTSYSAAITGRTDRRGATTSYILGPGLRLVGDSLPVAGAETIKRTFCPAEVRIWVCGNGLASPESTYTVYDGPRTDSTDVTAFWLDSLGAVTAIRDPYDHLTTIERADARWPELATRVQSPSGRVLLATYDARGNLATATDSNAYGDGRNPTTQYAWDQTWDQLTDITLPNGQQTQFGVDAANGNRLWVQDARGTVSRTTFRYYTSGNGTGLLSTIIPPIGAQTTITYDVRGNTASVQMGSLTTLYVTDSIGRMKVVRTPAAGGYRDDSTTYDAAGRVIREAIYGPTSGGAPAALTTRFNHYDDEGNLYEVQRIQSPDPTYVGWMTTKWDFDAANRPTVEIAPDGYRDSTWYDAAGNVVATRNRNGHVLTMTYDRMNRLRRRAVPAVTAPARTSPGLLAQVDLAGDNYAGPRPYPWFPNEGMGLKIDADTALFAYDSGGRLIVADNGDARVHRTYFASGSVQTDSLWIRDYADTTFGHAYGLRYSYDLNGRVSALYHPAQLAIGRGMQDHVRYYYSDTTGAITSVFSLLGNATRFAYDLRGELVRETLPGGIVDSTVYDDLGRVTLDRIANGSTSPYKDPDGFLRYTTLQYAAEPTRVSAALNTHGWKDTVTATYSGMGHLTYLSYDRPENTADSALYVSTGGDGASQTFDIDPLGNTYSEYATNRGSLGYGGSYWSGNTATSYYANATGRVDSSVAGNTNGFVYDSAGNAIFSYQLGGSSSMNDRASWYGADGRLRVSEWRQARENTDWSTPAAWKDVFEEYRYDALGRRVLVMSRWGCFLTGDSTAFENCQMSRVRRTVWDGARELWEIQMPARAGDDRLIENDTATVTYWAGTTSDGSTYADPNPLFGRVAYTYAGGVDAPVAITRLKLVRRKTPTDTAYWNPVELEPNWNWRGEADVGTFQDGGMETCTDSTHCVFVQWRGVAFATGLASELLWTQYRPLQQSPYGWFGTLINNKENGTGTFYRRSREVDPLTGRFTQEDPIGLAGGLNLYGFAAGDPVNYADPFGLCTVVDWTDCTFVTLSLAIGGGIGGSFRVGPVHGEAKALVAEARGTLKFGGDGLTANGKLSAQLYSLSGRLGPIHGGIASGCSVGTDDTGACKTSISHSVGTSGTAGGVSANGAATSSNTSLGVGVRAGILSASLDVDVVQGTVMAIGATIDAARELWNDLRRSTSLTIRFGKQ